MKIECITNRAEYVFAGCEALWRDAKYAVMQKSYAAVQTQQKALQNARGDISALHQWLKDLYKLYLLSISEGANRNAFFHVMGYFKPILSRTQRHELHILAFDDLQNAWFILGKYLQHVSNPYITQSYVWRQDQWSKVWFRFRKKWWQFSILFLSDCISSNDDPKISILSLEQWKEKHHYSHTQLELVYERLGLEWNGYFIPYYPLWASVSPWLLLETSNSADLGS